MEVRKFVRSFKLFHDVCKRYAMLSGCNDGPVKIDFLHRVDGPHYEEASARYITDIDGHIIDVLCYGNRFVGYLAEAVKEQHFSNKIAKKIKYEYNEQGNYSHWECELPNGKLIRFHLWLFKTESECIICLSGQETLTNTPCCTLPIHVDWQHFRISRARSAAPINCPYSRKDKAVGRGEVPPWD